MNYRHFILAGLFAFGTSVQAQVVINELMQSNIDCIMDDLVEFPDSWVELYNSGTEAVNLKDYKLGVKDKPGKAWKLPNKTLAANAYVVVYCDKEESGLHTNFRLETGKDGNVYLFQGDEIVDKVEKISKMPAPNIAYGRKTDGADEWGYQATPTPGSANCGQICADILGEPLFSQKGCVMTSSQTIQLTLSMPEDTPEGTVIRYTTNGSEPTATSAVYQNPINISSNKVIRAKLFCDGYLSPISTAQSYIFLDRDMTISVISIVTDDRYMNDNAIGIIKNNPNKENKKDWRRPINIEMFDAPGSESVINQLCETRVMGGQSREHPLKSLAVYANKRFGAKRFDYEFFPDQKPGLTDFKSIMLRNAGNDFGGLYMRDAIIQRVMAENADLDWQAWRPAVIFLNGTYKGMLNIRERSNDDNIYTNYKDEAGNGLEDIDMIEISQENGQMIEELKAGSLDNYNDFKAFYNQAGHTMEEYEQIMDCQEFINLMVMNLYYNNQDFPGNNIVMWRPRAEGGKWRFVAKDTDFGLGLYGSSADYNTIKWLNDPNYDSNRNWANHYEHTRLFRRMMEDENFKREFLDRAAIYMGDFLNAVGTREVWDPMYDLIKTEYPYHRKLINQWWPNYNDELNAARNWVSQRTNHFYKQLADYYNTGTPVSMTVNTSISAEDLEGVRISFNDVVLSKGTFNGKFFSGHDVTLKGTPINGKQVTGWKVTRVAQNGTTSETIEGDTYTFEMPNCTRLVITAMLDEYSGIHYIADDDYHWSLNDDLLTITGVVDGTEIMVYDIQGILVAKCRAIGGENLIQLPHRGIYILKIGNRQFKIR